VGGPGKPPPAIWHKVQDPEYGVAGAQRVFTFVPYSSMEKPVVDDISTAPAPTVIQVNIVFFMG